jgi:hypothetical protein
VPSIFRCSMFTDEFRESLGPEDWFLIGSNDLCLCSRNTK